VFIYNTLVKTGAFAGFRRWIVAQATVKHATVRYYLGAEPGA